MKFLPAVIGVFVISFFSAFMYAEFFNEKTSPKPVKTTTVANNPGDSVDADEFEDLVQRINQKMKAFSDEIATLKKIDPRPAKSVIPADADTATAIETLSNLYQQLEEEVGKLKKIQETSAKKLMGLDSVIAAQKEKAKEKELKKVEDAERRTKEREKFVVDMNKRTVDKIQKELGLDDSTTQIVSDIMDDRAKKYAELFKQMGEGSIQRENMREEMNRINEEIDAEMQKTLTQEQYDKYKAENLDRPTMGFSTRQPRSNRQPRNNNRNN